jgi:hypothetical protein
MRWTWRRIHGRRRRVRQEVTVLYGHAARAGAMPATLQIRIRPGARALAALRRGRPLRVSLAVTYATGRLFPSTQTRMVTVRWIRPRHGRRG